jgi:hypothetical protein
LNEPPKLDKITLKFYNKNVLKRERKSVEYGTHEI